MKLTIKINHPKISLVLHSGGKIVDTVFWTDDNSLSKSLLANIDKLLKKNKITIESLKKAEVESDRQTYTSSRIAAVVASTTNYCLTKKL